MVKGNNVVKAGREATDPASKDKLGSRENKTRSTINQCTKNKPIRQIRTMGNDIGEKRHGGTDTTTEFETS